MNMGGFATGKRSSVIRENTFQTWSKLEWQKVRERNEALDIRIYARAAAWILGADRWPETRWMELEGQFRVIDGAGKEASARTEQTRAPRSSARRTTMRSNYMV